MEQHRWFSYQLYDFIFYSTISTNGECCDEIPEYPKIYQTFIRLFEKCPENEEIIVRLAYILGNILSRSDVARVEVIYSS